MVGSLGPWYELLSPGSLSYTCYTCAWRACQMLRFSLVASSIINSTVRRGRGVSKLPLEAAAFCLLAHSEDFSGARQASRQRKRVDHIRCAETSRGS